MNEINKPDFTLELNSDYLDDIVEDELYAEAEERLTQLAADHNDLIGAAISLRCPAHGEKDYLHEATVVVYGRPDNIAASEKEANAPLALKHALDAAERQIRKRREKLGKPWELPGNHPVEQEIGELVAAESALIEPAVEDEEEVTG